MILFQALVKKKELETQLKTSHELIHDEKMYTNCDESTIITLTLQIKSLQFIYKDVCNTIDLSKN